MGEAVAELELARLVGTAGDHAAHPGGVVERVEHVGRHLVARPVDPDARVNVDVHDCLGTLGRVRAGPHLSGYSSRQAGAGPRASSAAGTTPSSW